MLTVNSFSKLVRCNKKNTIEFVIQREYFLLLSLSSKACFEKNGIQQKKTFGEIQKIYLTPYGI